MVRQSLTTDTSRADCHERLSDNFIERTYETRGRCVQIQEDNDLQSMESIEFSRVDVKGDRAMVGIELRGGDSDGVEGGLALVREQGDWRIDDLSVPLLRSILESVFMRGDDDLPPDGRACVLQSTRDLGDAELKEFAYGSIGQTEGSRSMVFETLAGCRGPAGRSLARELFEQELTETLEGRGLEEQAIVCIASDLRDRVPDAQLVELLAEDPQAIGDEATAAARACGLGGGPAS